MAKTISKKSSFKASEAKPLDKPPPGGEIFEIEPEIRFYDIEDEEDTEKGEEAETLKFKTKALRHLSITLSRSISPISICPITRDP